MNKINYLIKIIFFLIGEASEASRGANLYIFTHKMCKIDNEKDEFSFKCTVYF